MALFDHLVLATSSLDAGVEHLTETLGVTLPKGGEHPRYGTHNHVSSVGPSSFIEIIAVNADAPPRTHPDDTRWFALDDPAMQASIKHAPRLITWVLGTDDIHRDLSIAKDHGFDLGDAVTVTRGDMHWLFSKREDGALVEDGTVPILIEWPRDFHPAPNMTDLGLRIENITIAHPEPDRLSNYFKAIGADGLATVSKSAAFEKTLCTTMTTPTLGSVKITSDSQLA